MSSVLSPHGAGTEASPWNERRLERPKYTTLKIPIHLNFSRRERLAVDRPAERLRRCCIAVSDEALDPLLEMVVERDVTAAEERTDQGREPYLDLVDSGLSRGADQRFGSEAKGASATGVARKRLACRIDWRRPDFPFSRGLRRCRGGRRRGRPLFKKTPDRAVRAAFDDAGGHRLAAHSLWLQWPIATSGAPGS